jgi:hypothetical protein
MPLEGLNSFLSHVLPLIVGWDELVHHMIFLDCGIEFAGAFVFYHVLFWSHAGAADSIDEGLVCPNHLTRHLVFHCLFQDCIAVGVRQYHDVLIAFNSLTAIGGPDRQLIFELRARVVSPRIFVRSQSLIAR